MADAARNRGHSNGSFPVSAKLAAVPPDTGAGISCVSYAWRAETHGLELDVAAAHRLLHRAAILQPAK